MYAKVKAENHVLKFFDTLIKYKVAYDDKKIYNNFHFT